MTRARILTTLLLALTAACSDAGSTTTGGSTGTTTAKVMAACLNVCSCFSRAASINNCRDDCNRMSVGARVQVGRAFSGGSASFASGVFWTSAGASHMPTGACLDCLASASCATLENGTACVNQCQTLVPTHS